MSLVQRRLGASTVNCRPRRFGATGRLWFESVVALYFFFALALMPHELPRTFLAHPGPLGVHLFPDPRPAVLALGLGVDRLDMHQKRIVAQALSPLRTRAPAEMLVIAARAHPQHLALHRHRPAPPMAFDPGVLHSDSFAKYAVAFFRMSRSIFVRASSARKRLISICSGLTGFAAVPFNSPPASACTQLCSV